MMMLWVVPAKESDGCLSLLLEWRFCAVLLFLWILASAAWDILKALAPPPPPRLRYKVRVRVRRRIGGPKVGAP
ncbi:MAG TPA: hypothetical protein PLA48_10410 [Holophaga sp.]|nr:hypothetical protein [Holophaga sp.]